MLTPEGQLVRPVGSMAVTEPPSLIQTRLQLQVGGRVTAMVESCSHLASPFASVQPLNTSASDCDYCQTTFAAAAAVDSTKKLRRQGTHADARVWFTIWSGCVTSWGYHSMSGSWRSGQRRLNSKNESAHYQWANILVFHCSPFKSCLVTHLWYTVYHAPVNTARGHGKVAASVCVKYASICFHTLFRHVRCLFSDTQAAHKALHIAVSLRQHGGSPDDTYTRPHLSKHLFCEFLSFPSCHTMVASAAVKCHELNIAHSALSRRTSLSRIYKTLHCTQMAGWETWESVWIETSGVRAGRRLKSRRRRLSMWSPVMNEPLSRHSCRRAPVMTMLSIW